jgi:hypothetical protein
MGQHRPGRTASDDQDVNLVTIFLPQFLLACVIGQPGRWEVRHVCFQVFRRRIQVEFYCGQRFLHCAVTLDDIKVSYCRRKPARGIVRASLKQEKYPLTFLRKQRGEGWSSAPLHGYREPACFREAVEVDKRPQQLPEGLCTPRLLPNAIARRLQQPGRHWIVRQFVHREEGGEQGVMYGV